MIKKYLSKLCVSIFLSISALPIFAEVNGEVGQTIQITTRFHAFVGKPIWSLIIRDLDNNTNIPYIFDITHGTNFWVIFVPSRNYVITASRLQFVSYKSCDNTFRNFRVTNFCNLESNGHVIRGKSLFLTITGELRPNRNSYHCNLSAYANANFTVVNPDAE